MARVFPPCHHTSKLLRNEITTCFRIDHTSWINLRIANELFTKSVFVFPVFTKKKLRIKHANMLRNAAEQIEAFRIL